MRQACLAHTVSCHGHGHVRPDFSDPLPEVGGGRGKGKSTMEYNGKRRGRRLINSPPSRAFIAVMRPRRAKPGRMETISNPYSTGNFSGSQPWLSLSGTYMPCTGYLSIRQGCLIGLF